MSSADTRDQYVIEVGTFDVTKIVIEDPTTFTTQDGGAANFTSKISYLNEKGKLCKPLLKLPAGSSAGVFPNYEVKKPKTLEFIKGYQVCYNITSISTIEKPTEDEQYVLDVMDQIVQAVTEYVSSEIQKKQEDKKIPK